MQSVNRDEFWSGGKATKDTPEKMGKWNSGWAMSKYGLCVG